MDDDFNYKYLAKMFADVYAEKEALKSQLRNMTKNYVELCDKFNQLQKQMKGKENGKSK